MGFWSRNWQKHKCTVRFALWCKHLWESKYIVRQESKIWEGKGKAWGEHRTRKLVAGSWQVRSGYGWWWCGRLMKTEAMTNDMHLYVVSVQLAYQGNKYLGHSYWKKSQQVLVNCLTPPFNTNSHTGAVDRPTLSHPHLNYFTPMRALQNWDIHNLRNKCEMKF